MIRSSSAARYALGLALIASCLDPSSGRRLAPLLPPADALVGAGDIADCTTPGTEATAELLDTTPGTVFTAGDDAYPSGTGSAPTSAPTPRAAPSPTGTTRASAPAPTAASPRSSPSGRRSTTRVRMW